jgi:nucleotide-binding universal stress UspA family protein
MVTLSRILLVVDRSERAHAALNKALLLARYFHASVRIFLCETAAYGADLGSEPAVPGSPAIAPDAQGQEYVEALARTIWSSDVAVSAAAVHCLSLPQAVHAESRTYRADLIVVAAPVRTSIQLKAGMAIWQQVLACAIPVLITHGRPWNPTPQFAALVESTEAGHQNLNAAIARLSTMLSNRCQGELHLLLAATGRLMESVDWQRWWTALAVEEPIALASYRTIRGDLATTLSRDLRQSEYDLLIVSKPTPWAGAQPGVVKTIVESSDADVLLVTSLAAA